MKIAVVTPTNRPDKLDAFQREWSDIFDKHDIEHIVVWDGTKPFCTIGARDDRISIEEIMREEYTDLIYNHNDGVRNLGFALAYKRGADVIISLDDDVKPFEDPIQAHLDALEMRVPISWMNTTKETYMRGFPYGVRSEAEVVLSHGMWYGVADFDASTQLVKGITVQTNLKTAIPRGVLFPMCIMNVAFKRKMTPFMYQAPMAYKADLEGFPDLNRFADIWGGIEAKKDIDLNGWAAVTGYARVHHERASDPFANLVKEARGIGMNEKYGEDEYFKMFFEKRKRWQEFLKLYENN